MKTVRTPNYTIVLDGDKRIKHDAIRVVRSVRPDIGRMYADRRAYGMRYKTVARCDAHTVNWVNSIFHLNGIKAHAYLHQGRFMPHMVVEVSL